MKKKQVAIRIMFIIGIIGAASIAYPALKADALDAVAVTTSETIALHNQKMTQSFSIELEALSNELNTKVESINEENQKLRTTIENQATQIEQLSQGLKKLGVTFP